MVPQTSEKTTFSLAATQHQHQHHGHILLRRPNVATDIRSRSRSRFKLISALSTLLLLAWYIKLNFEQCPSLLDLKQVTRSELEPQVSRVIPAEAQTKAPLECFEVAQPVLTPGGPSGNGLTRIDNVSQDNSCSVLLMEHVFAFSYGTPFVGTYTPPNCSFNRVIMNFTVVSQGRQFDRLALMYFGDTEVWRTSTAEPTLPPGIRWTFLKDMTEYLYFWKSSQKLIFDLGNLVDDKYTGSFNATLTATFFVADLETDKARPADLVIPISARKGGSDGASHFTLPADEATNTISFPRNVNRAVFSVSANGQASEEFWWGNVPQSHVLTFTQTVGQLPGLSPFREVQLLIDGKLAGAQWPFPVIFTGGVVPSLHRPIVGLQAFDLREHQIDITPWLPLLCDGVDHTFSIKVAGVNNSENSTDLTLTERVNDSWYVTGKIFLWLDDEGSVTTGTGPSVEISGPTISLSSQVAQNATGFNETLAFNMTVQRSITIKSAIKSKNQNGESTWSQSLSYSNRAVMSNFGTTQSNDFSITGTDSTTGPATTYKAIYSYPLYCNQTYLRSPQGNLTIGAHLIEGFELQVEGDSVFPTGLEAFEGSNSAGKSRYSTSHIKTHRDGSAFFFQTGDGRNSSGYGSTNQVFYFGGSNQNATLQVAGSVDELYFRNVTVANGTVVFDTERLAGEKTRDFSRVSELHNSAEASLTLFAYVPGKILGWRTFTEKETDSHRILSGPSRQVKIA
ncbi:peptide-N4-(N-acetyl-beta-glucosaminyl)asparagine amidase A [Daldinia caldariorum]|uniref:peptide-N4-(N-acetyl-beta- glucosaminyl)asparagine amidase A n=1 Tax=Daldinia caldariorum TaxID=326644 RepID=UPI00200744D1|nr:peptide-N4-(N-acetyl-beta-glucosaminyl)asparagine amidase A [Daldinia caldariorum]KAI1468016.1 peptide-N4-(N-acetyl-beta-glucosaminyl)asparagine amidase A [Daldinia caldariorum]